MVAERRARETQGESFPFDAAEGGVPGETEITAPVVAAIAGHAACKVAGVCRLGSNNILRQIGGPLRSASGAKRIGVGVESGKKEAIFDIELALQYGHHLPTVVKAVRQAISDEMREQLGLTAKEINIKVVDVEFTEEPPAPRVQ